MPGPPIYADWWTGDWWSFEELPHPWEHVNSKNITYEGTPQSAHLFRIHCKIHLNLPVFRHPDPQLVGHGGQDVVPDEPADCAVVPEGLEAII